MKRIINTLTDWLSYKEHACLFFNSDVCYITIQQEPDGTERKYLSPYPLWQTVLVIEYKNFVIFYSLDNAIPAPDTLYTYLREGQQI